MLGKSLRAKRLVAHWCPGTASLALLCGSGVASVVSQKYVNKGARSFAGSESAVAVQTKVLGAIIGLDESIDLLHQVFDATERAAADGALSDEVEPDLHLVEPGGIGGSVVDVKAGPLSQPGSHLGVLVGGVVVHDKAGVQWGRDAGVQGTQEGQNS